MTLILPSGAHEIETDLNDEGQAVNLWAGAVPFCPLCCDVLAPSNVERDAHGDLFLACDCGLSFEVH